MAKMTRIDSVSFTGEQMTVSYTAGETPLPVAAGTTLSYTRQELHDAIAGLQDSGLSAEDMVLLALAGWVRADPNMLAPQQAANRTAQLDLLGTGVGIKTA